MSYNKKKDIAFTLKLIDPLMHGESSVAHTHTCKFLLFVANADEAKILKDLVWPPLRALLFKFGKIAHASGG